MIDFVEYVVSELKSRRLSRDNALTLIRQFSAGPAGAGGSAPLHPLLHRNASDIHQQCYRSTFDGSEFFLDDHQVAPAGRAPLRVLPGVAYLEMARAAVRDAIPEWSDARRIRLDDVVWIKPVAVEAPRDVFVALALVEPDRANGSGAQRVEFEIFTVGFDADGVAEEAVHCRGQAAVDEDVAEDTAPLDLVALARRMNRGSIDADAVYDGYTRMGMRFGPGHRAVRRVLRGDGEALAQLALPAAVADTHDDYALHPSLMDGALQSAIGLLDDPKRPPEQPSLPFALASLHVHAPCPRDVLVWLRHAQGSAPGDKVSRLDIDLCDAEGRVCVSLRGFASRALNVPVAAAAGDAPAEGLVLAAPVWTPRARVPAAGDADVRAHLLLCGLPAATVEALRAASPEAELHLLPAGSGSPERDYTQAALGVFAVLHGLLSDAARRHAWVQLVVADSADAAPMLGLSGLLKSAALEQPALRAQAVLVDVRIEGASLAARLRDERSGAPDALVRYAGNERSVRTWQALDDIETSLPQAAGDIAFKEDGVYLITGGLGGLGRLFANDILTRTARATVVLTGRAAQSERIEAALREVHAEAFAAGRLEYRALDLADADDVARAIADIRSRHRQINGILHAAGQVADALLTQKTAEDVANVLAPKVAGTVHLDAASAGLDLDFIALFSSGASILGNAGQSDYAAANGFLDRFAAHRNRLAAAGQRRGRTVAVNWPLWAEGGMRMPQPQLDAMRAATGMRAMSTANGMAAFHRSLGCGHDQIVAIEGELEKVRAALFDAPSAMPAAPVQPVARAPVAQHEPTVDGDLVERTRDYLRQQFSSLFKLPANRIEPHAPLEKYGIDSVLAMDLTSQLEKSFGPLSKTLFFEHQTIDELTAYFIDAHAATLRALFPSQAAAVAPTQNAPSPAPAPAAVRALPSASERRRTRRGASAAPQATSPAAHEPIAIVGLSGRYPQSPDLQAFWNNLRDGVDCIVEIPASRWDWRDYYSEDRTVEGAHFSKWGGFIEGVDQFDPLFFGIPPVDADMIDPQERLFLQHAWMAIEDAGYTRAALQTAHDPQQTGQVGVYVGVMYGEYQLFGAEASQRGQRIGVPVSYASIANRVSYLFNVHGPSMTLDTMCSSSLAAIHLACQDLRLGRTHAAIAGGVNVSIHPNKYLILSAGQYISTDGHCQSFGVGGDGYIPGEGVGAVVLKRLSDAERDGNHIYGLIRGSALNHGGKTNGYSVPNPKAQAAVIGLALKECGIDARHVGYIEAHGTGTRLGDPIEIAALNSAFRHYTRDRGFCAIGSAKSNIGHCESAAGIAGLTKVLLQMKHGMLVPSLHSQVLNPHIDFDASPFVVNQTLRPWERSTIDGRTVPRIAGISSFGAGGSNAHLIIEEYATAPAPRAVASAQVLVPLSARTPERLKEKARDLADHLQRAEAEGRNIDLQALAYTLQIGREPMDARLACVVDSVPALRDALDAYLRGDDTGAHCVHGQVEKDQDGMSVLSQDEDMREAIDKWIARRKYARLADLWVKGLALDWRTLHGDARLPLLSLPTYPFAKDRYWLRLPAARGDTRGRAAALHPLVHVNASDFHAQRYVSEFRGDEFFFADHRVEIDGERRKVLPGVAYLEMVRAAVALAIGDTAQPLALRNIAWSQPVLGDGGARLGIALIPADDDSVDFEIYSDPDATARHDEDARVVHCQGRAQLTALPADVARIDPAALRARMHGGTLASDALYATFATMGLHYGTNFRCVSALHRGAGEALAELALPDAAGDGFALHPGLLDSALQSALGLVADDEALAGPPMVPFALDEIALLAPCAPRMFAWVRDVAGTHSAGADAGAQVRKLDIDLCDVDGRVCVSLRGLASRSASVRETSGVLMARPAWEALPAVEAGTGNAGQSAADAGYGEHRVLLLGLPKIAPRTLEAGLADAAVERIALDLDDASSAARYRAAAMAVFERVQAILRQPPSRKVLLQIAVEEAGDDVVLAGLSGLIDTARLENPLLVGQLLLAAPGVTADALASQLRAAQAEAGESLLRYADGGLQAQRWRTEALVDAATHAYRDDGVYLITGGLGGLGLLFARDILRRTAAATVVLTGRNEAGAAQDAALAALRAECSVPATRLVYRRLDPNRADDTRSAVDGIVGDFGALHGVLHSAGLARDSFIVKKSAGDFAAVLGPKVDGTWHLDAATQALDLDFLVLFSSIASTRGNPGQADYAAANGFMDRYAEYRNALVAAGQRRGRTLSVHWPLWQDGGMGIDAETLAMMREASGMAPLSTDNGLRALHRALESGESRVLVVEGDTARLRRALQPQRKAAIVVPQAAATPAAAATSIAVTDNGDGALLLDRTQRYLREEFASLFRMSAHEVEIKAPLENYGMDSVLAMKLTNQLERSFGSLSKTLFFEYQTIAALAAYLVKAFPAALRQLTGLDAASAATTAARVDSAPTPSNAERSLPAPRLRFGAGAVRAAAAVEDAVVIVGLGGRYPQAPDLDTFWNNLKAGRDSIVEIPDERWDHAPYFQPGRNQPGKTYSKWGGFLDGIDRFDALFFSISPKEAELMDPQERLFLETAWETIEDAGYSKDAIAQHRVGVYVGVMWGQYELYATSALGAGVPSSSFASIANRVSYTFDFHGPSLALDTMCSSSLTAIHLAAEHVRNGTVDAALAGGVNVSVHPSKYLSLSQGNFASTDGRCRSFGEGGDGYVPGEGVGAVLLKRQSDALRDGDRIHAVIKAGTINHGGKTNGYTVPNPIAQSDAILDSLKKAGIDPASIGYIETHGTGTSLGDPIEITGLVRAYSAAAKGEGAAPQSCAIGSVKSNIGHLESAAGIAAVTKALLQLRHRQLVPSLHAERLNPHIDFAATPFHVQTALADWPAPQGHPRRVGVSSFGAGGANAHLILEEFVDARASLSAPRRPELFLLSARSRESLRTYATRMLAFLEGNDDASLLDIAFTSQVGRTPMQSRLAMVADSVPALRERLRAWLQAGEDARGRRASPADTYEGSPRDAQSQAAALIDGDAGRAFLQLTFDQRDLAKLAQLWIAGVEIDWAPLHRDARPQRMSLPTYPFVRERYWIESGAPFAASAAVAPVPMPVPVPRRVACYRPVWRDAPALAAGDAGIDGVVLLVGADRRLRNALASRSNGARVIAIDTGDAVRPLSGDDCAFDVSAQADLDAQVEALLDAVNAEGQRIAAVLLAGDAADGDLAQRLDRGVHTLHALCRAIARRKPKQTVRLLCLQRTGGDIAADAAHAALAGYLKSLALENPKFAWKTLSVARATDADAFAGLSADELLHGAWLDGEVAYVGAKRRQRAVVSQPLPAMTASALRQGGVYLITGGLGGLGALFAAHLARRYAARLVLTGRSAADDATQARLDALRSQGGEAIYVQADVAEATQAAEAVAAARTHYGRIDGVIHSAGIHRDAFALNKSRSDMAAVLAAKTLGTQHLDAALGDADLDFFALFSSVAGAFGNLGQCDYAYANAFMDAFAEARQAQVAAGARKGRTLSLGWPLWSEGGMRIADSDQALTEQRTGMAPLPTAEGIACWEAMLHDDVAHALPLYGDAARIDAYLLRGVVAAPAQTHRETPQALPTVAAAGGAVALAADDGALRAAAEHYLKTLLSAQIKLPVERIDADERFESFGVDSMMIARINADLERDLGDLPKTLFYEYASVAELAAYLLEDARPALSRVVSMPVAPAPAPVAIPSIAPVAQAVARSEPRVAANEDVHVDRRIAIIGLHGQFPQSESLADYWRHLHEGHELIGPVPPTRWDSEALYDADPAQAAHGRIYCKWGGFLQDVDAFDAAFFNISAEEAKILDPQERLFLQSVWSAVEDAGYTRDSLRARHPKIPGAAGKAQGTDAGVFVGVTSNTYQLLGPEAWHRGNPVTPSSMPWSIANRVSYVFDFQGPSLPIDTACSSSLVAIQMACDSLNRRECQLAVAGGVNLYLHPAKYHSLCSRGMLALEGQCRSFGTGDDGFIPGEGVGTVVLKPLAQAEADGDHIHGVIAGGATGHAGRSNGYSAPNPNAQAQLIEAALDAAGVHPEQIGYVEGHGTGTQLGDNLEVVALTQAFRKRTRRTGFCPLGSVKANVGHSESAAGMAGVAKLLLQFAHRALPPTIHAGAPNADIDFAASPFYLQRDRAPWIAADGAPRRAMINAFGAGGYNACLILEEYLPDADAASPRDAATSRPERQLIVLSARNAERLRTSAAQLRDRLRESPETDLARVAYTLQVGRETMEERFAVAATSVGALIAELNGYLDDAPSSAVLLGRVEAHQRRKSPKQDVRDHARALFGRGELDALALLWVGGQDVVWEDMHPGRHPQRLPLPTYPFARDRHWIVEAGGMGAGVGAQPADTVGSGARDGQAPGLHPLLSYNASTLRETAFVTRLDADAYYARDHRVNGDALFPGAGFLEIACVAGSIAGEQSVLRIEDIVWMQPLRLEGDASLKTVLRPLPGGDGEGAEFQIVSYDPDLGPMTHSEGRLRFGTRSRHVDGAQATFAIAELKARAQRTTIGADCYRSLQSAGFGYGPAFRTIQSLHSGSGFALAQLRLDDALAAEFDQYVLHPSLIDGALQSVLGVVAGGEGSVPYLPFAIGEIEILRPLTRGCYAYVEQVVSGPTAQPDVRQFDIRLLAENGDVLVRINNFYVRAFRGAQAPTSPATAAAG